MSRIKFRMVKFERGIAFQILEMDERFRKDENSFESSYDYHGFKIFFKSYTYPSIKVNVNSIYVCLLGQNRSCDFYVVSPARIINFQDNNDRDLFCSVLTNSLVEWANEWEGFKEELVCSKKEDGAGNHVFYINDEVLIKFQLSLFDKGIAFQLNGLHDAFRTKKWEISRDFITANFVIAYGWGDQFIDYCVNRDNVAKGKLYLDANWTNWGVLSFNFCINNDRDLFCEMLFDTLKKWQKESLDSLKYVSKRKLKNLGNDTYEI